MRLAEQFWHNLLTDCKLESGKALVAVSGGSDSVALLHLLLRSPAGFQVEPVIAHVNHQIRDESNADEAFCRKLAESLNLPFVAQKVDVPALAIQPKMSIETAARALRYQALHEMARRHGCAAILLGHTADDQAETVLHNISRGTGVRGLAGMLFRHGMLARPLLNVSKRAILRFLNEQNIAFRVDHTNADVSFRRNRIRHDVLPFLQQNLNPDITGALQRLAANTAEVEAFLQAMANAAQKNATIAQNPNKIILDIDRFSGYFPVLRKYIIRNSLEALSEQEVRQNYEALLRAGQLIEKRQIGKRTTLSGQWELLIDHDGIVIWNGKPRSFAIACHQDEIVYLSEQKTFRYSLLSALPSQKSLTSHGNDIQYVDANAIQGNIRIRSVREGDRFQPLGLKGSKLVNDFFSDRKVPLHKRSSIPVVACATGIIWVVGFQLDERFKVTNRTKSFLKMEFKEAAQ